LEGSELDFEKLHQRAITWAKENGLGSPEDVQPGHDETHVLVRDYLGKSAKAIGALIGEPSKGGPTNFEEVLVEAFEDINRFPKIDKEEFFRRSANDSFGLSERLGVLPPDHLYRRDPKKAVGIAVRYLNAISKREDFNQFLLTVKTARKNCLRHVFISNMNKPNLLQSFKEDPLVVRLMNEGNLERVAQLATSMGTAAADPELRRYGKELWERGLEGP
jgi:hypothetical protein